VSVFSCYRATSSPRFRTVLHTGVLVDGIWLAVVLVHVGVHEVDDIGANRRNQYLCARDRTIRISFGDGSTL
jgi:hypothetical protein